MQQSVGCCGCAVVERRDRQGAHGREQGPSKTSAARCLRPGAVVFLNAPGCPPARDLTTTITHVRIPFRSTALRLHLPLVDPRRSYNIDIPHELTRHPLSHSYSPLTMSSSAKEPKSEALQDRRQSIGKYVKRLRTVLKKNPSKDSSAASDSKAPAPAITRQVLSPLDWPRHVADAVQKSAHPRQSPPNPSPSPPPSVRLLILAMLLSRSVLAPSLPSTA